MANEPKLVAALEARLNKFESDLKQAGLIADREVRNIEDRFARANPRFGPGFLGGLFSGALSVLSVGSIAHLIQNTVEGLAKIGDVADRVGVTAEQLQELRYALEQSGGQAEQAGPALERFANNIAKAMEGEGKLGRFLEENNVRLKDRNGVLRPTADLLAEVANLIQNAASPQERLNIATEFFGRAAGPAMATALQNGSAGLRNFGAEAKNAGAVIENDLIKKAQEIDDQFQKLARTLSTTVKGAIISMIDSFRTWVDKGSVAAALDSAALSAEKLTYALKLARDRGSPVDPKWTAELERLLELQRESNRARGMSGLPPANGSSLPAVPNSGRPTSTTALHTRPGGEDGKDAFERATFQAEKRIAVLKAENEVIGQGTAAREKAKLVAELETAAKEANKEAGLANTEVTAAQRVEIDKLAESMLKAAQAAEAAKGPLATFIREGQDLNKNLQEVAVNGLRGLENSLVDIAKGTVTTAEAFRKMTVAILEDIGRIMIRTAIARAAGALLPGGGTAAAAGGAPAIGVVGAAGAHAVPTFFHRGGLVGAGGTRRGAFPAALWAGAPRYHDGGVAGLRPDEVAAVLQKGEVVVPRDVARGMGGGATITYALTIDARGADVAAVARLERAIATDRADFEARVRKVVRARPAMGW